LDNHADQRHGHQFRFTLRDLARCHRACDGTADHLNRVAVVPWDVTQEAVLRHDKEAEPDVVLVV